MPDTSRRKRASGPPAPPAPAERKSMQVYLRCIHCGRNQSRHLRTGRGNWSCRYCHELNPGPALTERVLAVRRKSLPPRDPTPAPDPLARPARAKPVKVKAPEPNGKAPAKRAPATKRQPPVARAAEPASKPKAKLGPLEQVFWGT